MAYPNNLEGDRLLAAQCAAGEVAAWEELYGRFHGLLCSAIRGELGLRGWDSSLVDKIAQRVWYALVRDDGALLHRYGPTRHIRLITFLRGVARNEIEQWDSQDAGPTRDGGSATSILQDAAMIHNFAPTLTAGEREFLEEHLLGPPEGGGRKWSLASIWKYLSRIWAKWMAYFRGND